MLTDFWNGLAGQLGKSWATVTLYPAFAFWIGGLVVVEAARGRLVDDAQRLAAWLDGRATLTQAAVIAGVVLALTVSGVFVQSLTFPVLRLLEGYWPRWLDGVSDLLVAARDRWRNRRLLGTGRLVRFQDLAVRRPVEPGLSTKEEREYARLDLFKLTVPAQPRPTRLGEILRAAEQRPGYKYGLDAVACWPQLWLVLPAESRAEVTAARSSLDSAVLLFTWAALFLLWTPAALWYAGSPRNAIVWAPVAIGLLVMTYAHHASVAAAYDYGDLMGAAYDVNRFALYEAMHWPRPSNTDEERTNGWLLTQFLVRGSPGPLPLRSDGAPASGENTGSDDAQGRPARGIVGAVIGALERWSTPQRSGDRASRS